MTALGAVLAYLVGALPVGFLVARVFGLGDIRRAGSGNIGATNVLRTLGRLPALLTLLGDIGKGAAAVAIGSALGGGTAGAQGLAAVAAVVGNCWPVYLKFRGGKGVATGLGAFLWLVPWATGAAIPVFVAVTVSSRYVSLASLLSAACVPFGALVLGYPRPAVLATLAVAVIVFVRHRKNIARLMAGTENRLGGRAAS